MGFFVVVIFKLLLFSEVFLFAEGKQNTFLNGYTFLI